VSKVWRAKVHELIANHSPRTDGMEGMSEREVVAQN
jgi:hypothetical protein